MNGSVGQTSGSTHSVGNVEVGAASNASLRASALSGSVSAGFSGTGSLAKASFTPSVVATLGATVRAEGSVDVDADSSAAVDAESLAANGSYGVAFGASLAFALFTPALTAGVANGADVKAKGNVRLRSKAEADAQAGAFGVNGGLTAGVGMSYASASVSPTLTTSIGSAVVQAGGEISLLTQNNRNTDGSAVTIAGHDEFGNATGVVDRGARAKATTASGGGFVGAQGGYAKATMSPSMTTAVLAGATLSSGGATQLRAFSNTEADARALGISVAGGAAFGATIADAELGGSVQTHFDGALTASGSLALSSRVDSTGFANGQAVGGAILASGNGTKVDANLSSLSDTFVGAAADILSSGDISVQTLLGTRADARASAKTFSAGAAAGATPVSAKISATGDAGIRGGATVRSTGGSIGVLAANNYDPGTQRLHRQPRRHRRQRDADRGARRRRRRRHARRRIERACRCRRRPARAGRHRQRGQRRRLGAGAVEQPGQRLRQERRRRADLGQHQQAHRQSRRRHPGQPAGRRDRRGRRRRRRAQHHRHRAKLRRHRRRRVVEQRRADRRRHVDRAGEDQRDDLGHRRRHDPRQRRRHDPVAGHDRRRYPLQQRRRRRGVGDVA